MHLEIGHLAEKEVHKKLQSDWILYTKTDDQEF